MSRVTNCLNNFKKENPEAAAYLAKKAGVDFDGTTGKEQYLAAIKELQQNSLDTINDIYSDLGIEGYKRVKLGENQISEAADIAGAALTPIQQRMNNADYIDQGELNQTADQLYELLDKIDHSSLTEEQKKSSFNLIEPLINQLESYELATTTKISTITEKAPTGRTAKTKIDNRPILERTEGSTVQVQTEDGSTARGTLNIRGGTYVVDVLGGRQRVIGDKVTTDRNLTLPDETEMPHPVKLDADGNVSSVTIKTGNGLLVTIEDPEKALDIAIQLQAAVLGEVPDGAFNEIYEEVEKQVTETVLVNEGKLSPADVHKAAKEATIDYESDEFMDKSEELTGKRHLDDMSVDQLRKVYQYLKSQKKGVSSDNEQKQQQGGRTEQVKVNSEKVQYNGTDVIGSRTRSQSEQASSRAAAKEKIKNPDTNASLKTANSYTNSVGLPEVTDHKYKPSDPELQGKIAELYPNLQDVNSPDYKETDTERQIFEAYKAQFPKIISDYDIKDYKDLVKKAYAQLIKEVDLQFAALTVQVTFHQGDKNYDSSAELLDDVHNFNHLWVYQGGEDHTEIGSKTTDANGLTANDKFRTVHDFFGHSVAGYQFGKDGEENAWIEHSKMFSPLAQWALSSETRGQNSYVNYSGVNEVPLEKIKLGGALKSKGIKEDNQEAIDEGQKLLNEANAEFTYAEQKAMILPPEFTSTEKYHQPAVTEVPKQLVAEQTKATTPASKPKPSTAANSLAATIRKGKIDNDITMGSIPFVKEVWNGALEAAALAIEAGGKLADGIAAGIDHIKNSDWYKSLSDADKKKAESRFRQEMNKPDENLSGIRKSLISDEIIQKTDVDRMGDLELMDLGRRILATGEVKPEALVQKILSEGTGVLKPAEVVALITYKADLDTLLRDAYSELNQKRAAGEDAGSLRGEIANMERQVSDFEVAAIITAATQSMAFRLRQYMLDSDYNVTKQIEKYKSNNNGYIPPEIEEKFHDLDRQLREVKDKLAAAERKLYDRQGQQSVDDIKESIKRNEGTTLYTQEQLEEKVKEGVQKTIDDIYKKLPKEKKSIADKAIKALENFQKKLRGGTYADPTGIVAIVDTGVVVIKNAIKAGVAVADAVEIGIRHIKDLIAKAGLTQFNENKFRQDALDAFKAAGVKTTRAMNDQPVINIDGSVTIPDEMLRQLVAQGHNNIEGLTDAVYDRVKGQLPDVTKRQIRDYITDYGKRINPTRDDLQLQVNAAKRVGKLLSELEDLQLGIRKQINPSARAKMTDKERDLKSKIKAVEKMIDKSPAEKSKDTLDNVERAKERIRTKIAELQTRIANNDFAKKEKNVLPATDPELIKLQAQKEMLQQEFDNEQYKVELKKRSGWKKFEDIALEFTSGLVRGLVAAFDLSAVGVQGLWRLFSNPKLSKDAFGVSVRHLVSEQASKEYLAKLKEHPLYPLMQASKLAVDDKSGHVSVKEGLWISNWINILWDKVVSPILGIYFFRNVVKKLNPYAASARAYDGYINAIRVNSFSQLAQALDDAGYSFESDPEVFEKAADFVNTTTGRATLGPLETNSRWLNTILFAPRKVAAELKLFTPYAFKYYASMPAPVRNRALISLGRFLSLFMATNLAVMASKKLLDPDDFEEDYKNFWNLNSSDFLTHHFGNNRISIGGGAKSLLTFMSRLWSGKFTDQYGVTTKLGERPNKDINSRRDLIVNFVLGKASPAIALGSKLLNQKKGRELDKEELVKDVSMPMWTQDVNKLFKDAPVEAGAILAAFSVLGANVRHVDPKEFKPSVTIYGENEQGEPIKRMATQKEEAQYNVLKTEKAKETTEFHMSEGVWVDSYGEVTLSENRASETIPFNSMTEEQKKAFQSSVNRSAGTKAKKELGWTKTSND